VHKSILNFPSPVPKEHLGDTRSVYVAVGHYFLWLSDVVVWIVEEHQLVKVTTNVNGDITADRISHIHVVVGSLILYVASGVIEFREEKFNN
jgi:hypothetical protein